MSFRPILAVLVAACTTTAQPPELVHYAFDEGSGATSTANLAVPGVGSDPAPISGHTIVSGVGCLGSPGLNGAGITNQVTTGWTTSLPGDWSVGFWLDMTAMAGSTNAFQYLFGDVNAGQFRCFTHRAAGFGNSIIRGLNITQGCGSPIEHPARGWGGAGSAGCGEPR